MPFFVSKSIRPAYVAQGVNFNSGTVLSGTTNTPFVGSVDGGACLVSFWFNMLGGNGSDQYLFAIGSGNGLVLLRQDDGTWFVEGRSSASLTAFECISTSTFLASSGWHHLLMARNISGAPQLFIDGMDVTKGAVNNSDDVDYNAASTITIGALNGSITNPFIGDVADLWIGYNQYLNPNVPANVQKFRTQSGRPAYLGTDGSAPTGLAPAGFFSGAAASWNVNKGSGGLTFTITGFLTASSTNP